MPFLLVVLAVIWIYFSFLIDSKHKSWVSILGVIIGAFVSTAIVIWALPAVGVFYPFVWLTFIFSGVIGGFLCLAFAPDQEFNVKGFVVCGIIPAVIFLIFSGITSTEMFHADSYKDLLEVEERVFDKTVPFIDNQHIRKVPFEHALAMADKALSNKKYKSLGSQLSIDKKNCAIQEVNGELWWIFPLDFNGFNAWLNRKSVPAYIRVSAEDWTREAQLVDFNPLTGEKFNMKYTPGAYWGAWLDRKVYFKYPSIKREECTFEVDDNWQPYYVYSATYPTIGFSGYQTKGVIICDPQTGKIEMETENIPGWVDRVKPLSQALDHAEKKGYFVNGWRNTIPIFPFLGSKKDMTQPTDYLAGADMWFVSFKGKKYWCTGMTSVSKSDKTIVGMYFIDTRSLNSTGLYFAMSGSDENGVVEAVDSSLGANTVKWEPTMPICYNIGGATWVVPVISDAGLVQEIKLVDVNNINIIGGGRTFDQALTKYKRARHQLRQGCEIAPDEMQLFKKIGPVSILDAGSRVIDGNKEFLFRLEGYEGKAFSTSAATNETLPAVWAKKGDKISIHFIDTEDTKIEIEKLQLEGVNLTKSKMQKTYDIQREKSKESEQKIRKKQNSEAIWKYMSPEDKEKAIDMIRKSK